MSTMDRSQALDILKCCFPKADSVRIVHHTLGDGESHFTSNINHLTVEYDHDGKCQRRHLVMKVPVSGTALDTLEGMNMYETEISFYEEVLPKLNQYLDRGLAPAHLLTTESKILVLEDATALGFESGEKFPLFDLHQAKSVLGALAHFHAASYKLRQENPHFGDDQIPMFLTSKGIECTKKVFSSWEPVLLRLLERKNETSLVSRARAALGFFKNGDGLKALLNRSEYGFVVLDHGDCRKENLLLKRGSDNRLEDVWFVDFQTGLWFSPLFDLLYFFVTSVSFDVVEAHYNSLVDGYLRQLNEELEKLGCSDSYTRADLEEDFKNLRLFLLYCLICMCTLLSPTDHQQKNEIMFESPTNDRLCDSLKNDSFVRAVYSWLKYFEKCGVFKDF